MRAEAVLYPLLPPAAGISDWKPVMVEAFATAASVSAAPARRAGSDATDAISGHLLALACVLGEGPLWDRDRGTVYWLDISRQRLHAYRPATREARRHRLPALTGAVVLCTDHRLLVATSRGIGHYDPDTGLFDLVAETEPGWPRCRFNDGKCDRAGRFWTGTMRLRGEPGREGLYRFEAGRGLTCVDEGFTVCNGLGWSPDDRTLYLTDTEARRIYAYDFDVASGAVANRRVFVDASDTAGAPDGLAVDTEGGVWVAIGGAWQLRRYDPDGLPERTVRLPVPRPTSCTFGGSALDTLYVTSSRLGLSRHELADAPLSGCLFAFAVAVTGKPEPPFSN